MNNTTNKARLRAILRAGIVLCLAHAWAWAGTVQTYDGKTYEGATRIEAGRVVVTVGRDDVRVDLAQVKEATLGPTANAPAPEPSDGSSPGGLKAEYFQSIDYTGPKQVRTDPTVQFAGAEKPPAAGTRRSGASVRWTGQIKPRYSGTFTFASECAGLMRLWIDNRLVLDYGQEHGAIPLKAGQKYDIRADYFSRDGTGSARVLWSSAQQRREVLPASRLYPPPRDPDLLPTILLTAPQAEEMFVTPASITVSASAQAKTGTIGKVEFLDGAKVLATVDKPPYTFNWANAAPGMHLLSARTTDSRGTAAASGTARIFVADSGAGTLPAPWGDLPIGPGGEAGSGRFADDVFTLTRSGGGAWDDDVGQRAILRPLSGDGQIIAHVASIQASVANANVMAGITLRESVEPRTAQASLLLFPGATADFVRRAPPPSAPEHLQVAIESPSWLRLVREGNTVKAFRSDDGRRWAAIGSSSIDLPGTVLVGFVAASQDSQVTCTARFDHVSVAAGPPADQSTVEGLMLRTGTILAGKVAAADDTAVRFTRDGTEMTVSTSDVARILYHKISNDAAAALESGHTGVLMEKGDFLEGEIRGIDRGVAEISSVLFGIRKFNVPQEATAIILRDPAPAAGDWEVRTARGSIIRGKSIAADRDRVLVDDAAMGKIAVPAGDVRMIKGPPR